MSLNTVVKAVLATTITGLLVSATAMAAPPHPPQGAAKQRATAKLDANGDGKVDQTEAKTGAANAKATGQAKAAEKKATADTNGDGVIDETEKAAAKSTAQANAQAAKASADANGDGKIDQAEAQAAAAAAQPQ